MKCPKCEFEQMDQNQECAKCGIIFEKFLQYQQKKTEPEVVCETPETGHMERPHFIAVLSRLFLYVKPETNPVIFWVRAVFYLILVVWGLKFIFTPLETNYTGASFWHIVNLPFHEAGHIIFRPFGRFVTSLGGSLMQLLMPLICLVTFLIKSRDTFAASFCLWWLGENFMDLAPYINDARTLTMPLLGGNTGRTSPYGFHDWEFILKESGLIEYERVIAQISYKLGSLLMVSAFIWGGYLLFRQHRSLKQNAHFFN